MEAKKDRDGMSRPFAGRKIRSYYQRKAASGIEPLMGVLQTPALATWLRRRNFGEAAGVLPK